MPLYNVITPRMMGDFVQPVVHKGNMPDKYSRRRKVEQLDLDADNVNLTEEQCISAQSVLAGIAFNISDDPDPDDVREVLASCGILLPLGSRFSEREAS